MTSSLSFCSFSSEITGPFATLTKDDCDAKNATFYYKITPKNRQITPAPADSNPNHQIIKRPMHDSSMQFRDGLKLKKCLKICDLFKEALQISGDFNANGDLTGKFNVKLRNDTEIRGEISENGLEFVGPIKFFDLKGRLQSLKVKLCLQIFRYVVRSIFWPLRFQTIIFPQKIR